MIVATMPRPRHTARHAVRDAVVTVVAADPDPDGGTPSDTYELNAYGVSVLVGLRAERKGQHLVPYVHIEHEADRPRLLLVEVDNQGETEHRRPAVAVRPASHLLRNAVNQNANSDDTGRTPGKRRPRKLPEIGTFYAKSSPLWRYQILGDRKPSIWKVTHHIDGRVAFDNDTEHTASGYWIKEYLTQCQQDGSPLDPDYIAQQKASLDRQEQWAASRPSLSAMVEDLLRDYQR